MPARVAAPAGVPSPDPERVARILDHTDDPEASWRQGEPPGMRAFHMRRLYQRDRSFWTRGPFPGFDRRDLPCPKKRAPYRAVPLIMCPLCGRVATYRVKDGLKRMPLCGHGLGDAQIGASFTEIVPPFTLDGWRP